MGFHHVDQACLKLPTSGDPPALACQSAGIAGMSLHARPRIRFLIAPTWVLATLGPTVQICRHYAIRHGVSLSHPGWSAVAGSRFTVASNSQVQVIILPQPSKMGFHLVGQTGLKLLISSDPPASKCWDYRYEPLHPYPSDKVTEGISDSQQPSPAPH
ncbi:hypothetical protein AAY473_030835 [Plecturocebus cupreus]